jgi:hypothetical protein
MPQNIIDTVFPATQGAPGSLTLAPNVTDPFSPGPGANNAHPAGVEANTQAPGLGVAAQSPSFGETPASVSAQNQTEGGAVAPGFGDADDSPVDDSNDGSGCGPIGVRVVGTALGRTDGGLLMPGGAGANVVQDRVATQVFGNGVVQNVNGGSY